MRIFAGVLRGNESAWGCRRRHFWRF